MFKLESKTHRDLIRTLSYYYNSLWEHNLVGLENIENMNKKCNVFIVCCFSCTQLIMHEIRACLSTTFLINSRDPLRDIKLWGLLLNYIACKANYLLLEPCLVNVEILHPDHHTARPQPFQWWPWRVFAWCLLFIRCGTLRTRLFS